MNIPANLRYTEDHEWIDPATGKIGITDFAQDQLGDVVYLDFAVSANEDLDAKAVMGTVESVKTVSDIYAPLPGKLVAANEAIADNPEVVNTDPYGEGWMFQVELADAGQLDGLLDADAYKKHIEG